MRASLSLPLALAASAALAAPAAPPSVPARGRIVEVTVFRDRAEIVREATVELPAGPSTVAFPGIPFGVDTDSIRVSATGVPATLGAVEVRGEADAPAETAELRAALEEVRRLERELAAIRDEAAVDAELRQFLTSIRATTAETGSRELGEGRADPAALTAVYALLADKLRELGTRALERAERERKTMEALEVARAKLATLRPSGDIRSRVATVEVEARRAGSMTMRLAYVAPGAWWRPSYRASLDAASGDVSLSAEGIVQQRTGEDWSGVALRLSTASPAEGVEPPHLAPWYLRPIEPVPFPGEADLDGERRDRVFQKGPAAPPARDEFEAVEAEVAEAGVVTSAYSVAFEVPGASSVPADGRDHRVVLRTDTLPGALAWRTVPALDPRAFLTAVVRSPAGWPLLAGPVRVFAGGAYLGSFPLDEKGPGVEVTFPFGVDNRVEVVRVPLPREASREGLGGKQREVDFAFRTKVRNGLDRSIPFVLEDRVPVSEDERITVELTRDTTPGHEESERRPGVLLWTFELAPGEEREIVLAYRVRWPRELVLPLPD
jgi:uncharacterized protein (TIGR02231 family)